MWTEIVAEYLEDLNEYLEFATIYDLNRSLVDHHYSHHTHPLAHIEFAAEFIVNTDFNNQLVCSSHYTDGELHYRTFSKSGNTSILVKVFYQNNMVHRVGEPACITYHNSTEIHHFIQNNRYFNPDGPCVYSPFSDWLLHIHAGQIHNAENQPARIYYHDNYKIVEYRQHNRLHSTDGWAYGIYDSKRDKWFTTFYFKNQRLIL